ncbi:fungal hydrophobin [Trametes cingulata]|nr:fungal hydrophobin [Trametes cingulata]
MFARLPALASFASLAVLAVATPAPAEKRWNTPTPTVTVTVTAPAPAPTGGAGGPTCSTGPIQCCNSVASASDPVGSLLLGLLGIVVEGVDVLLGLDCSPISVIGVGTGNACSANTVCCENNNVGGLISIGCVPIIL